MTVFKIITLGCKVNQYESAYLRESLLREGWIEVVGDEKADVMIINTCTVTQRASYQSRQAIRKAIRENPSGYAAAVGCYAQVFPEELRKIEGVGLVAGNVSKGQLPAVLNEYLSAGEQYCLSENFAPQERFEILPVRQFLNRTRAFLKIQDGCRSFCSYCIVPYARGPLRSLAPEGVLSLLRSFSEEGYREVVLTGIHLGKYGVDLDTGMDLKRLLRCIGHSDLPLRIRLSSLYPDEIDPELVDMIASEEWLCPHFHISLQSGDDGILKRMKRKYGSWDFEELIEDIRRKMPFAAIGADLIAGFPGESAEAFSHTYHLIERLPVSYLHVFPFSPRKGTPAATFPDQVKPPITKERARELRKLGLRKRMSFYRSCLGLEFSVLTEGWESQEQGLLKGLSANYIPVTFPFGHLQRNTLLRVRVERVEKGGVIGKVL